MTQHNNNLSLNQQGRDVALLQSRLITMGYTIATSEILSEHFGESTQRTVRHFQQAKGLPATGIVDSMTAQSIVNTFEAEKTVLMPHPLTQVPHAPPLSPPGVPPQAALPLSHLAASQPGQPPIEVVRTPTPPISTMPGNAPVIPSHPPVLQQPVPVSPPVMPPPGGEGGLPGPGPRPVDGSNSLQGAIYLEHGLPANGLAVRLYHRGFGGADALLATTQTNGQGAYTFSYNTDGQTANLDVRVVGTDGKEVSISATQYNPGQQKTLNLIAPAHVQPLSPEYERLSQALNDQLGQAVSNLGKAQEDTSRQDLTLLAQSTGWDPRIIALAATANTLSATTNLGQDTLYALFRAGLPTDPQQLAWVDPSAVQKALGATNAAGITGLSDQQITAAGTAFTTFARGVRLSAQVPGTSSSFGDLLGKAGLSASQQESFIDLYFSQPASSADFWQQAQQQKIPQANIDAMRLQGKLAYLTLNNAELTASLQQEIGNDPAQLVDKDLYKPDGWKKRLGTLTGKNGQSMIPSTYVADGAKDAESLDAYANDLARKVRISYPTQVVGRMLANNELQLNQGNDNQSVKAFLQNATPLGFVLGHTVVDSFVNTNQAKVFPGANQVQIALATQNVKTLQRLYQITPTNESLKVMLDHGFTSAHDVVAYSYDDFQAFYGNYFPSQDEAQLTYRKSQQISVVTRNFFSAAQQLTSTPPILALSAPQEQRLAAKETLSTRYPSLNTLFGSLDFCECEHCHSVLSPAAYFVDLLQFLEYGQNDPLSILWTSFLADWKTKHNDTPYPFQDPTAWTTYKNTWQSAHPGVPVSDTQKTPYTVLTERRPDLPYLPLTCENTNTVMPYIDLVNEILEYFIAHGSLDPQAVYDIGNAATPDLLAEPQNILPAAYNTLKQAVYPLALPFDLWLETVRSFFDYYQLPFWQVLDVFRPTDELFAPLASPESYYRAAILAEELSITPGEYALYTSATPLTGWFVLYGYATETEALTALASAKTLSQRLGVSYKDLIALMETGFINPQLNTLGLLYKLGVVVEDVFRYEGQAGYQPFTSAEKTAFEQKLSDLSTTFSTVTSGFDAQAWLHTAWQNGTFHTLLVLYDTDPGGNFDATTLQYANGTAADNLVFLKINLFVRLWKRLGWSMEETDHALQVFLPQHTLPLTGANIGAAFTTALLSIAHLHTLVGKGKSKQNGRLQLLTLWSNLATMGATPLYAQLFLTRSILQNDLVFDHPLGLYLTYFDAASKQYQPFYWDHTQPEDPRTGNVALKTHLDAVQGALNLSADEVEQILISAGKTLDSEPLTLATLSLLYRYGLLAKALGLSVKHLLALKNLSGLDPFTALSLDPVTQLGADYPLTQTLSFVDMVATVKASGFTVEDINYLLCQRFDPVGKYRPDPHTSIALVKTLAAGLRGIATDNAVPGAPSSLTDDVLRQKLALALPSDVVDTFFAMWTGTVVYTVTQNNILPADQLQQADYVQEPEIQVSYDPLRQMQQLTFHGVLFDDQKTPLEAAHPSPVLTGLLNQVEGLAQTYYASYLQPFLKASDFTALFTPLVAGLADADRQIQMQSRRLQFAQAFLPYLQQKLIRQFVVATLATTLAANPTLTEDLLTDISLLNDPTDPPAAGLPAHPLLGAFTSSADQGITVAFYASPDGSGSALNAPALALTVDTAGKPSGTSSAHFAGYLEVPTSGAYRFFVALDKQDARAAFRLTSWPDPLLSVTAPTDRSESSQFIELKAGTPYQFTFDASILGGGDASLLVQGENLPRGPLARLTLYTQAAHERVTRAQTLLTKTLQIISTFGFSEVEVHYLLTHAADFASLNLSTLPTQAADDTSVGATALFAQFLRLAGYASLKSELSANTDDLVDLFAHARLSYPVTADANKAQADLFDDLCQRVANLTRRDAATVQAVARALGFITSATSLGVDQIQVTASNFTQEQGVQQLWTALQTISTLGVSMGELARWLTPAPDFTVARDLRNTVKAHYEPTDWQRIAQPIFDRLRQRQRDSLVAYIMQQQGFTLPEQLFEYFLIDPGMEPVVQTSRIVQAISSVQTFVQRCLLNLELEVHPLVINADEWLWMKRYRVWEANRKIYLFPENVLEMEFRDDKTNLFRDLEGKLLQSDITNDLAEDAFFNYLKDLEMLARLEIVSMYCDEQPDPSDNVLHIIGRTHNTPYKYFYRTYAHQMWTPWVPVTINIDGDLLVAAVWKQRLHLFWVTFKEQVRQEGVGGSGKFYQDMGNSDRVAPPPRQVDVQLSWSEYFQGKWASPQSSGFGNLTDLNDELDPQAVFIYVTKETVTDAAGNVEDGAIDIYLNDPIHKVFRVVNKNSPPQASDSYANASPPVYDPDRLGIDATMYTSSRGLDVKYTQRMQISGTSPVDIRKAILQQGANLTDNANYALLVSSNPPQQTSVDSSETGFGWFDSPSLVEGLTRPFFYQDNANTFFVEPTMTETTIDEWDWWVIQYPRSYSHLNTNDWWSNLNLQASVPVARHLPPISQIDPTSLYQLKPTRDWATNPATVLRYGGNFVGAGGGLTLVTQPGQNGPANSGVQLKPVAPGGSQGLNGNGQVLNGGNLSAILQASGMNLVNQSGLTRGTLANVQVEQHYNGNGFVADNGKVQ